VISDARQLDSFIFVVLIVTGNTEKQVPLSRQGLLGHRFDGFGNPGRHTQMTLLYNVWCDVNGETICVVGRKKKHSQHGLPLFDFVWSKKVGEQDGCVVVDEV
jgi:hypothetical protein